MDSFHQQGDVLDIVAGSDISSGDTVVTGGMVGIAVADIASGETGAIQVEGVIKVTKVAGEAWVVGDKLGWDASASGWDKTFTATTGDVETAGRAAKAAASADTVGYVKLTPGPATAG